MIVAIGAILNDGVNGQDSGHVRVYGYNGSGWIQLGGDIDGEAAGSGRSVSLSSDGKTVAIGAPKNDENGSDSGHVRVFKIDDSDNWIQLGFDIDGEAAGDWSGYSVSLSSDGKTVAIGARSNDVNGSNSGHARVYGYNGSGWIQLGGDIDGEAAGDYSGWSVSLSSDGKTVAIGASFNDGNGTDSGHVRVFKIDDSDNWIQLGGDIDGEAASDYSGFSVSLSSDGKTVAIGANSNNGNAGHVRVFKIDDSDNWIQLGLDIDGEAAYDYSGESVTLSSDGMIVAIGAPNNDGVNGDNSGHARVYGYNGSGWIQLGGDIDGETAGDQSGKSVTLSSDGKTVAIGAPYNDGNGQDSGHVRVYEVAFLSSQPTHSPSSSPTMPPSTSPSTRVRVLMYLIISCVLSKQERIPIVFC